MNETEEETRSERIRSERMHSYGLEGSRVEGIAESRNEKNGGEELKKGNRHGSKGGRGERRV